MATFGSACALVGRLPLNEASQSKFLLSTLSATWPPPRERQDLPRSRPLPRLRDRRIAVLREVGTARETEPRSKASHRGDDSGPRTRSMLPFHTLLECRHGVSTVPGCESRAGEVLRGVRRTARPDLPALPSRGLPREEFLLVVRGAARHPCHGPSSVPRCLHPQASGGAHPDVESRA